MVNLDDIKKTIDKLKETEIIKYEDSEDKKLIKFKKGAETYTISILPGDSSIKTKLKLIRLTRFNKELSITYDHGEKIVANVNLHSDSPCKVSYTRIKDEFGLFIIQNIFTDRIDSFEKMESEEDKISALIILILGMMIEIMSCIQDISTEIQELASQELNLIGE